MIDFSLCDIYSKLLHKSYIKIYIVTWFLNQVIYGTDVLDLKIYMERNPFIEW